MTAPEQLYMVSRSPKRQIRAHLWVFVTFVMAKSAAQACRIAIARDFHFGDKDSDYMKPRADLVTPTGSIAL